MILAGVSINLLLGDNGIITKTRFAKEENQKAQATEEVNLAINNLAIEENEKEMTQEDKRAKLENELKKYESSSTVTMEGTGFLVNHRGYDFEIDSDYEVLIIIPFTIEEWDKTAAPENVFIWKSDDPNDEGYGIVVGYTANADNYTVLRFPSRCTKIMTDTSYITDEQEDQFRSYTKNIKKIELPETITEIGYEAFSEYDFQSVNEVNIPKSVKSIEEYAFGRM